MTAIKKYFLISFFVYFSLLLTACAVSPGVKYLKRGQAAYQMQDYHTAFQNLLASAKCDNTMAEYAVGYMYYYGIGTKRDLFAAVAWFQKAARYKQPDAIKALELIKQSGPPPFTFGRETTTH